MRSRLTAASAAELQSLEKLSERLGRERMLVQAASGNTSAKLEGALWIKASGKWLANAARESIFVPVPLAATVERIAAGIDPAGQTVPVNGNLLGTSVETAMHAVLPHRIVAHVHSVHTISLAVREDGERIAEARLRGMDWAWVPYVPSGLALARAVDEARRRRPRANVLLLANHGLVVAADNCAEAERLLVEVECRLGSVGRWAPAPDLLLLHDLAAEAANWRVPRLAGLHGMATDLKSAQIAGGGVLYPCQAIFLTAAATVMPRGVSPEVLREIAAPFVLIEGAGMLVHDTLDRAQLATLEGLAEVVRRVPERSSVRYLREPEVRQLLCADVYRYRARVQKNSDLAGAAASWVPRSLRYSESHVRQA